MCHVPHHTDLLASATILVAAKHHIKDISDVVLGEGNIHAGQSHSWCMKANILRNDCLPQK